jgi:hypothetical protein
VVGFDYANPVRGKSVRGSKVKPKFDHKHRLGEVQAYEYRDAATLAADFWTAVDAMLREHGMVE